jgi:hypothetical protein
MSKIYVDEILPKTTGGVVTTPEVPAFNAYKSSGNTASGNDFVFDAVDVNVGSNYNASTGVFTAPVSGNYFFSISALADFNQSTGDHDLWLLRNGANYARVRTSSNYSGHYETATITAVVNLSVGDEVKVYVASGSFYGDGNRWAWFSGHLIG